MLPPIPKTKVFHIMKSPKAHSPRLSEVSQNFEVIVRDINNRRMGRSFCFLCARKLTPHNRSDEHVFPKWMQARFNLSNQKIILLNGTIIPYRQLTIPSCKRCNNIHLGHIERSVEQATAKDARTLMQMNQTDLLIWLSKLMYGLVYKEHLLNFDRSNPLKGRLIRRTFLQRFKMFYLFMQAARLRVKFQKFFPASIFVFKTQVPANQQTHFDFVDNPYLLTIACRLGPVGIIAALQDGGAQKAVYGMHMSRYKKLALHPLQFTELVTLVFHRASLFNRTPKYMTVESEGELLVHQFPLGGFSTKPLFDRFDVFEYARHLSARTGYSVDQLYQSPDKFRTWLEDASGRLNKMDVRTENSTVLDRREIKEALRGIIRQPLR